MNYEFKSFFVIGGAEALAFHEPTTNLNYPPFCFLLPYRMHSRPTYYNTVAVITFSPADSFVLHEFYDSSAETLLIKRATKNYEGWASRKNMINMDEM